LTVRFDSSVQLVWDDVLVGVDEMDEFVSIVDAGEMTRRSSVSAGLSFCSAAKVYQSELSQCSKPTNETIRTNPYQKWF
jgi:hypothetical protein